jgi:hypothetical protein
MSNLVMIRHCRRLPLLEALQTVETPGSCHSVRESLFVSVQLSAINMRPTSRAPHHDQRVEAGDRTILRERTER